MSIETRFDIPFIAAMALKEKQVQQNFRPIIAVHKWFARRPGTLFRGLILAEFGNRPVIESFFQANDFPGRLVADPFMGGGTPLLEANRVGCDIIGCDINPMAAWIVREEIEHIDLPAYRAAADVLMTALEADVGTFYRTDCPIYGDRNVPVKYFLWVKVLDCERCGGTIDLFPGYLLADDTRHTSNVLVCADCGDLNEVGSIDDPGRCRSCSATLLSAGPARRNRCACRHCGQVNRYPRPGSGPLRHRLFAIEYHNPHRKGQHRGRFFKRPDAPDLKRAAAASVRWQAVQPQFVPEDAIPPGDETNRLHRWGYRRYCELFNERQLLGLEASARHIAATGDGRVRRALATNLSDLLRYQNMLCRYDTMALKSLDIFSVHGFPVGLVQCESNLFGIANGEGTSVGSGGWRNIVEKYARAKQYCAAPFETRQAGGRKSVVPITGEWIGDCLNGENPRSVDLQCTAATALDLVPESLDAVFTDPPYFGNVQYSELIDFCYVWLRRLAGAATDGFGRNSTRSADELTGNETAARGLEHFTDGLAAVYSAMARALKPSAPLAFTFHHNKPPVYHAVGIAILDAGLVCTAALPCPAEMGGSIHIHGTGSSIIDTVFVCRRHGRVRRDQLCRGGDDLVALVRSELDMLRLAGVRPTPGDIRCILLGHLTRLAVWRLRDGWDRALPVATRLKRFAAEFQCGTDLDQMIKAAADPGTSGRAAALPREDLVKVLPDAVSL